MKKIWVLEYRDEFNQIYKPMYECEDAVFKTRQLARVAAKEIMDRTSLVVRVAPYQKVVIMQ